MPIKSYTAQSPEFNTADYIMHDALESAVEVALALGQPLLLTGEPGTGKTRLAYKVAADLASEGFLPEPLKFNTKTTSVARDLFYTYDAVAHFQAANIKQSGEQHPSTAEFIELQALGKAIAYSNPTAVDTSKVKTELPDTPKNSVVLVDEIDKAPRDFTNDILNEIENYQFNIKELSNYSLKKNKDKQVLIIMTSNSEKNLPDAFLRRCVFYHIPFPNDKLLLKIAQKQLGTSNSFTEQALKDLIAAFEKIRDASVRKPPATAELIGWLRILELKDFVSKNEAEQRQLILNNLSVLVKTKEDLKAIKAFLKTTS